MLKIFFPSWQKKCKKDAISKHFISTKKIVSVHTSAHICLTLHTALYNLDYVVKMKKGKKRTVHIVNHSDIQTQCRCTAESWKHETYNTHHCWWKREESGISTYTGDVSVSSCVKKWKSALNSRDRSFNTLYPLCASSLRVNKTPFPRCIALRVDHRLWCDYSPRATSSVIQWRCSQTLPQLLHRRLYSRHSTLSQSETSAGFGGEKEGGINSLRARITSVSIRLFFLWILLLLLLCQLFLQLLWRAEGLVDVGCELFDLVVHQQVLRKRDRAFEIETEMK